MGAAALGAAATAIGALGKAAITNYAEYEQLVGGVETLFGASASSVEEYAKLIGGNMDLAAGSFEAYQARADKVLNNAKDAYKTAGMSANEYMETVTSFSASLISSLGEYQWQAANYADQAITDMADNANKMGTSIDMIQNAYQGFAKQNFTMLDNLKLGYGGTQEEMDRLLRDAENLEGLKVGTLDRNNFADVVDAIHAIQENMGITGTTAKEAASTISGSIGTMKAAWENFLTGMADPDQDFGALLNNLVDSVVTVAGNIGPRIVETLPRLAEGIAQLAAGLLPHVTQMVNEFLPALVDGAASLMNSFVSVLPGIVNAAVNALPQLASAAVSIISNLVAALIEAGTMLLDVGIGLLDQLTTGIESGLPDMISRLPQIITEFINFYTENMPKIATAGFNLLIALADGIIEAIPDLVAGLPQVLEAYLNYFVTGFPQIVKKGGELLGRLIMGIIGAIPEIAIQLPAVIEAIVGAFEDGLIAIGTVGGQLIMGLWEGISDKVEWLKGKVAGVVDTIKSWFTGTEGFDEHSPSKWAKQVFQYVMEGGAQGLEAGAPALYRGIHDITDQVKSGLAFGTATVGFADSGLGRASAATVNAITAAREAGTNVTLNATLVAPDGTKFADYYLPSFIKSAAAGGTPIANPQTA